MIFVRRNKCGCCGAPIKHGFKKMIRFIFTYKYLCAECGEKLVLSLPSIVVLTLFSFSSALMISVYFNIELFFSLIPFIFISGSIGFYFCPFKVDPR